MAGGGLRAAVSDVPQSRALARHPVHLGKGAGAAAQPEFTGMEWYAGYEDRHGDDGAEGRLVSQHRFTQSWNAWEMHPAGAELVICTAGAFTLIQQEPGGAERRIALRAGEYAINEPGVWHTADLAPGAEAEAIFITAGLGTEHRGREQR